MTETTRQDDARALDAALAALRATPPDPAPALMARVLADAAAVQARRSRPRLSARLSAWFGSGLWAGPGLGVAAAAAGLMIGLADPAPLDLIGFSTGAVTLLPEGDLLAALDATLDGEDMP